LTTIVVIGAGVVGATIAYKLSTQCNVTLVDRSPQPASGSTGAALGLLMGIISQKVKGQAWQRREQSIRYYHQLLPQLAAISGILVSYNSQGLLKLIEEPEERSKWQALADIRKAQGWTMELWEPQQLQERRVDSSKAAFAVYSPADWQVNPLQLTRALVAAGKQQGVCCLWDRSVMEIRENLVVTDRESLSADWIVIAAGLGSTTLAPQIQLMPVLGQAIHYQLPELIGIKDFQPVLTRNDLHLVPLGGGEYWVGATVEFPVGAVINADPAQLDELRQRAIDYFPALALAQELKSWWGLRPRPIDRPAPVIEQLGSGLLVATGHYRNGVLLAPATAAMVRSIILG
jgi:glycine/D-amino acid oxidase-like deaminating enzyme